MTADNFEPSKNDAAIDNLKDEIPDEELEKATGGLVVITIIGILIGPLLPPPKPPPST